MKEMLLQDLLDPSLCSVSCSSATIDQYPAHNLLLKKGFMVEGFVKPPVRLDFTFHSPVHIVAMVTNPQLGSHCAQVMVALVLRNHLQGENTRNQQQKQQQQSGSLQGAGPDSPQLVDKLVVPAPGSEWHCRFNTNYAAKEVLQWIEKREPGLKIEQKNCLGISAHPRHLYHVKVLKIEILKAFSSRVPSLGGLRVFGVLPAKHPIPLSLSPPPSLPTGPSVTTTVTSEGKLPPAIIPPYSSSPAPDAPLDWRPPAGSEAKEGEGDKDEEEEVDPSFIDPITFSLMVDPVILPSGHVVDRQTLTRHLSNSSTNPFTGLRMTARDVVPNTPLKARIDSFLLSRGQARQRKPKRMIPFSGEARTLTGSFPRSHSHPAGEEVLDSRGGKRLKLDPSQDRCPLCRKDLAAGVSMVLTLPGCGHRSCRPCLLGAINQSGGALVCPQCARPFLWNDVVSARFH